MIRGIIFDCFGVLYGGSAEVFREMCSPDRRIDFDDIVKQADYGFITGEEYIAALAEILGKDPDEIAIMLGEHHVRNTPLFEYMRTLRPHYKVGLLSNVSSGRIEYLISKQEQDECFDEVVLSCDVHLTKPDPNIFTLTAERLGLQPEECVMIDDRAENCEGASRAGLKTIWHASNEQTVQSLQELLAQEIA